MSRFVRILLAKCLVSRLSARCIAVEITIVLLRPVLILDFRTLRSRLRVVPSPPEQAVPEDAIRGTMWCAFVSSTSAPLFNFITCLAT